MAYAERIADLADRARRDRESFEPPSSPPAPDRAMTYLREGVGPVVALYIDARTGDRVRFDDVEHSLLERALNDWLELYAACYGRDIDAEFTVREAAELLVETHNIRDVAQLLTHVPSLERDRRDRQRSGADDRTARDDERRDDERRDDERRDDERRDDDGTRGGARDDGGTGDDDRER